MGTNEYAKLPIGIEEMNTNCLKNCFKLVDELEPIKEYHNKTGSKLFNSVLKCGDQLGFVVYHNLKGYLRFIDQEGQLREAWNKDGYYINSNEKMQFMKIDENLIKKAKEKLPEPSEAYLDMSTIKVQVPLGTNEKLSMNFKLVKTPVGGYEWQYRP
jgi:hypothetical protein